MDFRRLDNAMQVCRTHLDSTKSRGTEVESYLVGHLLVAIFAEYELCLQRVVAVRAAKSRDHHLANVMARWAYSAKNRMKIGDLKGHLGAFSETCSDAFTAAIDGTPGMAAYASLESHRQTVAHKNGISINFADLETAFSGSQLVLVEFAKAIGLSAGDIANLAW